MSAVAKLSIVVPCPCCDGERAKLSQLEIFALGVAVGEAFRSPHDFMCTVHREAYGPAVQAAMKAIAR